MADTVTLINSTNGYQGQLAFINIQDSEYPNGEVGDNNEIYYDFFGLIEQSIYNKNNLSYVVNRLGIQANPGQKIKLRNSTANEDLKNVFITIGKTGIYEISDVSIDSIKIANPTKNIIIDYIIKAKDK